MPRVNILIVEDSAPDAMLMRIALDAAGFEYDLTALRDGAKAVEYLREYGENGGSGVPDIILLDVNVPKVNGLEVLQAIRATDRLASTPVLVLSSSRSPRDQTAVLNVKDARYEVKPSDLDGYLELGRTIRSVLEVSQKSCTGERER